MIAPMAKATGSVLTGGLKGSAGTVVFVSQPYGMVVRPRQKPNDPHTTLQEQSRVRMRRAAVAWRGMTVAQADAWRKFAVSQRQDARRANTLFCRLAVRYLQMFPDAEVPLVPPSSGFAGDAVAVTVTPNGQSVRFSANMANQPEVMTELLLQPLASPHRRTYLEKYRSAGFFRFGPSLSFDKAVPKGVYACAVRFVQSTTGQTSPVIECGTVQV